MLTNNDKAWIYGAIADGLHFENVQTADDTPATVKTVTLTAAEGLMMTVRCVAMKDTTGFFVAERTKVFFYDGTTVNETGGYWGAVSAEYLGTGLSTCDFDWTLSGSDVSVVFTGEAAANISANFKISIQRLITETLPT